MNRIMQPEDIREMWDETNLRREIEWYREIVKEQDQQIDNLMASLAFIKRVRADCQKTVGRLDKQLLRVIRMKEMNGMDE